MGRCAGFKSQIEDGIEEYHKVQTQDDRPVLAQGLRMAEGKEKLSDQAVGRHTDESGHFSQGFTEAKKTKRPTMLRRKATIQRRKMRRRGDFTVGSEVVLVFITILVVDNFISGSQPKITRRPQTG
jgi:hypothetical protein